MTQTVPERGSDHLMPAPATVVFDVLGTLFSLDRLRAALRERGAPAPALELWFGQCLRDYFAHSHAGGYIPLKQVLQAGLPRALAALDEDIDETGAQQVLASMSELEPAPGALEACAALDDRGVRLVALSNGSLDATTDLIERAGLAGRFSAIRSCDEIRISKPAGRAYDLAREDAEGTVWMVAAHAWDIGGALLAGLRTVWVAGVESEYLSAQPEPDVKAPGLAAAAEAILDTVEAR